MSNHFLAFINWLSLRADVRLRNEGFSSDVRVFLPADLDLSDERNWDRAYCCGVVVQAGVSFTLVGFDQAPDCWFDGGVDHRRFASITASELETCSLMKEYVLPEWDFLNDRYLEA